MSYRFLLLVALLVPCLTVSAERRPAPFRPGERIAFVGDSITHASKYLAFLQMRLATGQTENPPIFVNCGINGDMAAGVTGSGRIGWDVLRQKPNRVFVMLGMNDVIREYWKTVEPASPAEAAGRERAIAGYESSLRNMVKELIARVGPVVLMTPSPYDQYGTFDDKALLACNEPGLSRCAAVVRKLGDELNLPVVDLHAPMTALVKRGAYERLCGNDRVHPGDVGHSIIAALILNACGASSEPFEELAGNLRTDGRAPLALEYAKALSVYRRLAEYRKVIIGMGGDPDDRTAADGLLDRWVEKNKGYPWYEGCRNAAVAFRDLRNREDEIARDVRTARERLLAVDSPWTLDKTPSRELSPIVPFVIPAGRPGEEEVRSIVRTLDEQGFDQFLIYPSTGLDYEYLGEEFFRMDATFLDEAKRRGMKVWLYDEFNWPSGTAHGRVPAENEAWLYRELVATTNGVGQVNWQELASREINVDNYCLDSNNCEEGSVRRFMELTHDQYERRFREYFGSTIQGIFSDEPGHCSGRWRLKTPPGTVLRVPYWSSMEEEYRRASGGRDFRRDYEEARASGKLWQSDVFRRWSEIRSVRYRHTFFDPIRAWCDRNGLEFCGHLYGEEATVDCTRINGLPLRTLQGFGKPGIDLLKSDTGPGYEWITLAFAQAGARLRGKPGVAELFGLGPCDITFAMMRKLYWLCALHHIDTFFQATYHTRAYRFDIKDSWAMFTSPTQPWFGEMPLLHETAKEAARWARKPFRCDIAVVYPQRRAGAASFGADRAPTKPLGELCAKLTWRQLTYDLVEEDEKTDHAVVLDWRGDLPFDRRSGRAFASLNEAVSELDRQFADRPRVKDASGATRPGFVTRAYLDGSAVSVDASSGEVIVVTDGNLQPRADVRGGHPVADRWELKLSGPTKRRMWLGAPQKIVLSAPLKGITFALRNSPTDKPLSVTLDGKALSFPKPCTSVAAAYDELYRETEPMDLAAGEHVFELTGGTDGKLFLPVLWMIGNFAERTYGTLEPPPSVIPCGTLAEAGLGSFAGVATYCAEVTFAPGERLRVNAGGAVARVRLGGRDLGAKGWAPYEWEIPAALSGRSLNLEIDVITSIRPIFGSTRSPEAKLDHKLWVRPELADPSPAGLRAATLR